MPGKIKMKAADSVPNRLITGEISGTSTAIIKDSMYQISVTKTLNLIQLLSIPKRLRKASRPQYKIIGYVVKFLIAMKIMPKVRIILFSVYP